MPSSVARACDPSLRGNKVVERFDPFVGRRSACNKFVIEPELTLCLQLACCYKIVPPLGLDYKLHEHPFVKFGLVSVVGNVSLRFLSTMDRDTLSRKRRGRRI